MKFRILTRQKELEIMSKTLYPEMLHFKVSAAKYVENNDFDSFLSIKLDLYDNKNQSCGCVYDQFMFNEDDISALKFKQFARALHMKDKYKSGNLDLDDIIDESGYLYVTVNRNISYHKGVQKRYIVDEYLRTNENEFTFNYQTGNSNEQVYT